MHDRLVDGLLPLGKSTIFRWEKSYHEALKHVQKLDGSKIEALIGLPDASQGKSLLIKLMDHNRSGQEAENAHVKEQVGHTQMILCV